MSLLELDNVSCRYRLHAHWLAGHQEVRAVDGVSFMVASGERLALVGESGSGKSTLARAVLLLEPTVGGRIVFDGEDIESLRGSKRRDFRRQVQMVFQDAHAAMNPRMSVAEILTEPVRCFGLAGRNEEKALICGMLERCGLTDKVLDRYSGELSGGECQRVAIARALLPKPRLVVFDEATSSLDVTLQNQILSLIQSLHKEMGLTYLFITHNLAMVPHIADRVGVMQAGKLVEILPGDGLHNGKHPYTRQLINAMPIKHPRERKDI